MPEFELNIYFHTTTDLEVYWTESKDVLQASSQTMSTVDAAIPVRVLTRACIIVQLCIMFICTVYAEA